MKIRHIIYTATLFAGLSVSCVSEEPFGSGSEGQLCLVTEINGDVKVETRADDDNLTSNASLREKCVVYIESSKGVVRKFIGLDNVPQAPITLKNGHYVAEAWTGDSVSASFSSKFYRGKEEFDIAGGDNKVQVLKCNIANVIVSVNQDVLQLGLKNVKIVFSHSRGSLEFTEENIATEKGYFMMPNADKNLQYTVTGEKIDGTPIMRTGVIENVQRAHEYIMNITAEAGENNEGGGLIKISIQDVPVINETVNIYGRPTIAGEGFDIDEQIIGDRSATAGTSKAFTDHIVFVRAYAAINHIQLVFGSEFAEPLKNNTIHLFHPDGLTKSDLADLGIDWDGPTERFDAGPENMRMEEMRITFKKKFFDSLAPLATEYKIKIIVQDNQEDGSKTSTATLRIATSEEAIEHKAPVETADAPDPVAEPMAILAHSATVYGKLVDETVSDYGIKYRKQGTSNWTAVSAKNTRATSTKYSVNLTGLEAGTTYEYKAYSDEYDDGAILTFTTESHFIIPNASMEQWSNYSSNEKILLPGAGGERTFWDSGNHGSATMSVTLTQSSEDLKHSGNLSAKLRSQFVGIGSVGKFAAGNLFVGEYYKTNGTNGEIYFGREYNGSHPKALKLYVNYRPAVADKNGSKNGKLKQGDLDKGQVYVALTTEKIHIDTRYPDTMLWNTDAESVLAYGEKIFSENYGPDGSLQELIIPLDYKASAKSIKPQYLVIVCTASYYGDYFDGGEGSTMYVDDFELIYE